MAWGGSWWTPDTNYGADQNWYDTDVVTNDPNVKYRGEWERFFSGEGFGGYGRRDQWGQNMFNRAMNAYEAAWQSNPNLTFRDYLAGLGPGFLEKQYAMLTPQQRGDFLPGQTRWIR